MWVQFLNFHSEIFFSTQPILLNFKSIFTSLLFHIWTSLKNRRVQVFCGCRLMILGGILVLLSPPIGLHTIWDFRWVFLVFALFYDVLRVGRALLGIFGWISCVYFTSE